MERGLLPQGQAVALVKVMPRQISLVGVRILEGIALGSFLLGVILLAANGGGRSSFSLLIALPVYVVCILCALFSVVFRCQRRFQSLSTGSPLSK